MIRAAIELALARREKELRQHTSARHVHVDGGSATTVKLDGATDLLGELLHELQARRLRLAP